MRLPTPNPPLPERPRLGSAAQQAGGTSTTSSSEAGHAIGEASEPSPAPSHVTEAGRQHVVNEAASDSDRTRAGDFAGDSILQDFTSVRDLTSALDNSMLDVLASGVLSLLSSHSGGIIHAAARTNTYIAAERIVLEAVNPQRTDIRMEILAFIEARPELHSCLRNPPQLVQGDPSNNGPSRRAKSSCHANAALRKTLRDELQPVDNKLKSDILKGCLSDTRVQVLEDLVAAVKAAVSSAGKQVVWLRGLVGAGKTTVMFTVAAKLDESFRTAQFYCSRADAAQSDPHQILPTIACSLGTAESTIGQRLEKAIQSSPTKVTVPSEQLNLFICGPLEGANGPTLIFVDGLDECASDDALGQFLTAIAGGAEHSASVAPTLVFVVSSRPEQRISAKLSERARAIDLDDARYCYQTQADTEVYIRHQLPQNKLCASLATLERPISYEEAIAKLAEVVGGRFVVASLTCSTILESDGDTTFLSQTLRQGTVSAEVVSLYEQFYTALKAIFAPARWRKSRIRQDVRGVLATICCAQEPLSSPVIAHMCDVALGSAEAILRALAPLLVHPSDRYTFFHASVADFLRSEDAADYRVSAPDHHGQLFLSCRAILHAQLDFNVFGITNSTTDLDQLNLQAISPELTYASVFWTHHLIASSLRPEFAASEVATLLRSKFLFWLEVLSGLRCIYSRDDEALDQVSVFLGAAGGGIVSDCQRCLDRWGFEMLRHPRNIYLTVLPWLPSFFREQLSDHGPWILSLSSQVHVRAPSCWGNTPHAGAPDSEPLDSHTGLVYSIAFNPDGARFASGSADNTVRLWDATSGAPCGKLEGHSGDVYGVAFSSDGLTIASGSHDRTVRLWDAHSGAPRGTALKGHIVEVGPVAFRPDSSRVASGSSDGAVRLWDADSGAPCGMPFKGHTKSVESVAFSPDGSKIASASGDKTIRLWDAVAGVAFGDPLEGHADWVLSVAFSPDGLTLASGSLDGTVRLWSVETGVPRCEPLEGHTFWVDSVAFSEDGNLLCSVSPNEMLVWDLSGWVPTLCDPEQLPVRPSTHLTPKATLALPSGYEARAFSPALRKLAGRYGPGGCQVFALSLPSYDPWKTLCDAHAESQRDSA